MLRFHHVNLAVYIFGYQGEPVYISGVIQRRRWLDNCTIETLDNSSLAIRRFLVGSPCFSGRFLNNGERSWGRIPNNPTPILRWIHRYLRRSQMIVIDLSTNSQTTLWCLLTSMRKNIHHFLVMNRIGSHIKTCHCAKK